MEGEHKKEEHDDFSSFPVIKRVRHEEVRIKEEFPEARVDWKKEEVADKVSIIFDMDIPFQDSAVQMQIRIPSGFPLVQPSVTVDDESVVGPEYPLSNRHQGPCDCGQSKLGHLCFPTFANGSNWTPGLTLVGVVRSTLAYLEELKRRADEFKKNAPAMKEKLRHNFHPVMRRLSKEEKTLKEAFPSCTIAASEIFNPPLSTLHIQWLVTLVYGETKKVVFSVKICARYPFEEPLFRLVEQDVMPPTQVRALCGCTSSSGDLCMSYLEPYWSPARTIKDIIQMLMKHIEKCDKKEPLGHDLERETGSNAQAAAHQQGAGGAV